MMESLGRPKRKTEVQDRENLAPGSSLKLWLRFFMAVAPRRLRVVVLRKEQTSFLPAFTEFGPLFGGNDWNLFDYNSPVQLSRTKVVKSRDDTYSTLEGEVVSSGAISNGPGTSKEDSLCF